MVAMLRGTTLVLADHEHLISREQSSAISYWLLITDHESLALVTGVLPSFLLAEIPAFGSRLQKDF
jgi:hypothetical protein